MAQTRAAQGREADQAAVAALSRDLRPALLRYFERRGVAADEAEDAAQEVFARLSPREGVAANERLDANQLETAANVAIDFHRRGVVRLRASHETYVEAAHAPADFSPERLYSGREELGALLVGLRELPERTRNVFLLARLENMKQAEIARRLGVSVSGVEKHLARAIAHLSKRLGRTP
jgi:RNA polymerase sigma-70 factor (ECF subfamily)